MRGVLVVHGPWFALVVRFHNPNSFGYWTLQHAVIVINNCNYFHFQFCFLQVVDIPNEIAKSGHIYFPEFCKLVLDRFRQIIKRIQLQTFLVGMNQTYRRGGTEDDLFRQNMFKVSLKEFVIQNKYVII